MEHSIKEAKTELRRRVRAAVSLISEAEKAVLSAQARQRLVEQPQWREARSVLFYAPMFGEVDVWPLLGPALAEGKSVGLPRFEEDRQSYVACRIQNEKGDIVSGRFGIREAAVDCEELSLNRLDLILVPGVAFDPRGRRLGRGKGYYDQLLTAARGPACGVAFDQQIVREIPVEAHDEVVNCILTPSRWFEV